MQRVRIKMEFVLKTSTSIVYKFLTTPSCLIRWFCDEVDIDDDKYVYTWDGQEEVAFLIEDIEDELLRFRWEFADEDDEYFEYRMSRSEVTNEAVLEITDFCDADEVQDHKRLWESQINNMKLAMGGV